MLVFARSVGQCFDIDESTVFLVIALGKDEATLLRTDGAGLHADELTIKTNSLVEISPGVKAMLIADGSGVSRIGFEAAPTIRIRRVDGAALTATRTVGRSNRI